jgi:hypothetical protein
MTNPFSIADVLRKRKSSSIKAYQLVYGTSPQSKEELDKEIETLAKDNDVDYDDWSD